MLDIRLLRDEPDRVKERLALVGCAEAEVQAVIDVDRRHRDLLAEVEQMRAERRASSKKIGKMKPGPDQEAAKAEVRELGDRMAEREKELTEVEAQFRAVMLELPNIPHDDVPPGADDSANIVVRTEGAPREFGFTPKPHWEIGEQLGIIDFERGVKISGTRFYVLKGAGARLQRALISFMLDLHTREHGYTEIYPPAMVRGGCGLSAGDSRAARRLGCWQSAGWLGRWQCAGVGSRCTQPDHEEQAQQVESSPGSGNGGVRARPLPWPALRRSTGV